MYLPPAFEEKNPDVLREFVRVHPLGLLISLGSEGILANAIPFAVHEVGGTTVLRAHLAKGNAQWQTLEGQDVLVVFQGANSYVSPQWYPSKRDHGRVVPTWNYALVQMRGRARVIHDRTWLHELVSGLTDGHEKSVRNGSAWKTTDAPADFMESQVKGIVGLEIEVRSLTGKFKASQNRPAADRAGVVAGLTEQGNPDQLDMAELVKMAGRAGR